MSRRRDKAVDFPTRGIPQPGLILLRFCGSLTCTWCHRVVHNAAVTRLESAFEHPRSLQWGLAQETVTVCHLSRYTEHLRTAILLERFQRVSHSATSVPFSGRQSSRRQGVGGRGWHDRTCPREWSLGERFEGGGFVCRGLGDTRFLRCLGWDWLEWFLFFFEVILLFSLWEIRNGDSERVEMEIIRDVDSLAGGSNVSVVLLYCAND